MRENLISGDTEAPSGNRSSNTAQGNSVARAPIIAPSLITPTPQAIRSSDADSANEPIIQRRGASAPRLQIIAASLLIAAMGIAMGLLTETVLVPAIISFACLGLWAIFAWQIRRRPISAKSRQLDVVLHKAKLEAEAANEAKTRFLAIASHEMRTPLNGILGMAKMLDETQLSPEQANYNNAIKTSGDALFAFVEDMLDVTRIETGHFTLAPSPTDIRNELENICELLAPRAHEKSLEIAAITEMDLPQFVEIDARRLRQVLVNLLGNAMKFTSTGGICIRAKRARGNGAQDQIKFQVSDTGPGIAEEDKLRVFDEFEQVNLETIRKFGGAGLGLAISKAIVEKMSGTIRVSDNQPVGSIFTVTIPLKLPESNSIAETQRIETPISSRVVTVLNGTLESPLLGEMITQLGYSHRDAHSLNHSLDQFDEDQPGKLIIDDANASDQMQRLAKLAHHHELIILLDPASRDSWNYYRKNGFSSYLIRPVRQETLQLVLAGNTGGTGPDALPNTGYNGKYPSAHSETKGKKILLVEDNSINALLARTTLEKSGHKVTHAENGKVAVAMVEEALRNGDRFPLIYMDLHMPVMDGLRAISAIRKLEKHLDVAAATIVALSADEQKSTQCEVLGMGANRFLAKPLDPMKLSQDSHT